MAENSLWFQPLFKKNKKGGGNLAVLECEPVGWFTFILKGFSPLSQMHVFCQISR